MYFKDVDFCFLPPGIRHGKIEFSQWRFRDILLPDKLEIIEQGHQAYRDLYTAYQGKTKKLILFTY